MHITGNASTITFPSTTIYDRHINHRVYLHLSPLTTPQPALGLLSPPAPRSLPGSLRPPSRAPSFLAAATSFAPSFAAAAAAAATAFLCFAAASLAAELIIFCSPSGSPATAAQLLPVGMGGGKILGVPRPPSEARSACVVRGDEKAEDVRGAVDEGGAEADAADTETAAADIAGLRGGLPGAAAAGK